MTAIQFLRRGAGSMRNTSRVPSPTAAGRATMPRGECENQTKDAAQALCLLPTQLAGAIFAQRLPLPKQRQ